MDAPRKTTHRISKPGVLSAAVGFLLVVYSIRWSRAGEGLGIIGILGVMFTSTLGALLLQGGLGFCMAWFMATNARQDGGLELPHSEPNSSLRGVGCEKQDVGTQGMWSSWVHTKSLLSRSLGRLHSVGCRSGKQATY